MNKVWRKYLLVFVCFLIVIIGFSGNPDTTKIPYLKLNNHRVKSLIRDLIKEGHIEDDDVLLISFIEENNEQYLYIGFSNKERHFLLSHSATSEIRDQKFMGYSKILQHDCFIFGGKAKLFFVKKGVGQIPDYFQWLLSLNKMEVEDFFPPIPMSDSDGNSIEVTLRIVQRGRLYKYINPLFVLLPR